MKQPWSYVVRASAREKALMEMIILEENEFQQQEPGGWDENDCPIHFKLERHSSWQMQAYTPSGKMMDGFHEGFIRCNYCGGITTWGGEDFVFCTECEEELMEDGY